MKLLFLFALLFNYSENTQATIHAFSWYFNQDGGFGIYQPEGWSVAHRDRSSTIVGPEMDSAQSEIFMGSDWNGHAQSLEDLKMILLEETGLSDFREVQVSGLSGFAVGTPENGAMYIFRVPENFIVVRYELRGSNDQIEEGKTMLSSIEIRTGGLGN